MARERLRRRAAGRLGGVQQRGERRHARRVAEAAQQLDRGRGGPAAGDPGEQRRVGDVRMGEQPRLRALPLAHVGLAAERRLEQHQLGIELGVRHLVIFATVAASKWVLSAVSNTPSAAALIRGSITSRLR